MNEINRDRSILVRVPKAMQQQSKQWQTAGKSIGFVPTMGALHPAHLSLVKASKRENDVTVVSIFVNPTQFAPHEDYARYPKTLEKDLALLEPYHVDAVFHPEAADMFPSDFQTRVRVEKLSEPLYGAVRPHFFGGVALVVLKLFHIVQPTRAYFGEKDYQQFLVIRQMMKDLNLNIHIVPCPLVREEDGLAMSSRNVYLTPEQRQNAPLIYAALQAGRSAIENGEQNTDVVVRLMEEKIRQIPEITVDYIAVADPLTLEPLKQIEEKVFLGVAARIGQTRLIDGLVVQNA